MCLSMVAVVDVLDGVPSVDRLIVWCRLLRTRRKQRSRATRLVRLERMSK